MARTSASERTNLLQGVVVETRGQLVLVLYCVCILFVCAIRTVSSLMTKQAFQDLVTRSPTLDDHVSTAGHAIREAGFAASCGSCFAGSGFSWSCIVSGKMRPHTFSGTLTDWKAWRFTLPEQSWQPQMLRCSMFSADRRPSNEHAALLCRCPMLPGQGHRSLGNSRATQIADGWRWLVKRIRSRHYRP